MTDNEKEVMLLEQNKGVFAPFFAFPVLNSIPGAGIPGSVKKEVYVRRKLKLLLSTIFLVLAVSLSPVFAFAEDSPGDTVNNEQALVSESESPPGEAHEEVAEPTQPPEVTEKETAAQTEAAEISAVPTEPAEPTALPAVTIEPTVPAENEAPAEEIGIPAENAETDTAPSVTEPETTPKAAEQPKANEEPKEETPSPAAEPAEETENKAEIAPAEEKTVPAEEKQSKAETEPVEEKQGEAVTAPAEETKKLAGDPIAVYSVEPPSPTLTVEVGDSDEAILAALPKYVVLHASDGDQTAEVSGWTLSKANLAAAAGSFSATVTVTLPEGYAFEGKTTTDVRVDITVLKAYKVTFSSGRTSGEYEGEDPAEQKVREGAVVTMPENPYTVEGETFKGWQLGDKLYAAGAKVPVTADTAFVAAWSGKLTITKIEGYDPSVTVQGGSYENIKELSETGPLPSKIYLNFESVVKRRAQARVEWKGGYEDKPGEYTLTGTFEVPSGYRLAEGLTNTITVKVTVLDESEIITLLSYTKPSLHVGLEAYEDKDALDDAGILPSAVKFQYKHNGSDAEIELPVASWTGDYDGEKAGTYTLTANFDQAQYGYDGTVEMTVTVDAGYQVVFDLVYSQEQLTHGDKEEVKQKILEAPATQFAAKDSTLKLPEIPGVTDLAGYRFDGWKTGDTTYKVGDDIKVENNTTLKAAWTRYIREVMPEQIMIAYVDLKTDEQTAREKLPSKIYVVTMDGDPALAEVTWELVGNYQSSAVGANTYKGTIKLADGYAWSPNVKVPTIEGTVNIADLKFYITNDENGNIIVTSGSGTKLQTYTPSDTKKVEILGSQNGSCDDTFYLDLTNVSKDFEQLTIGQGAKKVDNSIVEFAGLELQMKDSVGSDTITTSLAGGTTMNLTGLNLFLYADKVNLKPASGEGKITMNVHSLTIEESPRTAILGIQNMFTNDDFQVNIEDFVINAAVNVNISINDNRNGLLGDSETTKALAVALTKKAQELGYESLEDIGDISEILDNDLLNTFINDDTRTAAANKGEAFIDMGANALGGLDDTVANLPVYDTIEQYANSSLFLDYRNLDLQTNIRNSTIQAKYINIEQNAKMTMNVLGAFVPLAIAIVDVDNHILIENSVLDAGKDLNVKAITKLGVSAMTVGAIDVIPLAVAVTYVDSNTTLLAKGASELNAGGNATFAVENNLSGGPSATHNSQNNTGKVVFAMAINKMNAEASIADTTTADVHGDLSLTVRGDTVMTTSAQSVGVKKSKGFKETIKGAFKSGLDKVGVTSILDLLGNIKTKTADGFKSLFSKNDLKKAEDKLNDAGQTSSEDEEPEEGDEPEEELETLMDKLVSEGTLIIKVKNDKHWFTRASAVAGAVVMVENTETGERMMDTTDENGEVKFFLDPSTSVEYKWTLISIPNSEIEKGNKMPDFSDENYKDKTNGTFKFTNEEKKTAIVVKLEDGNPEGSTSAYAQGKGKAGASQKQKVGAVAVGVSNTDNLATITSDGKIKVGGTLSVTSDGTSFQTVMADASTHFDAEDSAVFEYFLFDPDGNPVKGAEVELVVQLKDGVDPASLDQGDTAKNNPSNVKKTTVDGKEVYRATFTSKTDDSGLAVFIIAPSFFNKVANVLSNNCFGRDIDMDRFDYLFTVKQSEEMTKNGWTVPDKMKDAAAVFTKSNKGDKDTGSYIYSFSDSGRLEGEKKDKTTSSYGLGVAVAVLVSRNNNQAILGGDVNIEANGLKVAAASGTEKKKNGSNVSAKAGYSIGNFGFGGAIAVSVVNNDTIARLEPNTRSDGAANVVLGKANAEPGDLVVTASNLGAQKVTAATKKEGIVDDVTDSKEDKETQKKKAEESTGVGAGIAVSTYINDVSAEILGDLINAVEGKDSKKEIIAIGSATIKATNEVTVDTSAQAGAEGGKAIAPVIAVDVLVDRVNAELAKTDKDPAVLTSNGTVSVIATGKRTKTVKSDAQATGKKAAVGGAIAVSVDTLSQIAHTDRKIRTLDGGLVIQALDNNSVTVDGKASAKGSKEKKDKKDKKESKGNSEGNAGDGDDEDPAPASGDEDPAPASGDEDEDAAPSVGEAEENVNQVLKGTKSTSGADIPTETPINASTTEGSVNVAAAIVLEILNNTTTASLDNNVEIAGDLDITAGDDLTAKTEANAKATVSKTGVGVAVALEVLNSDAKAYISEDVVKVLASSIHVKATNTAKNGNKLSLKATSGAGATDVGVAGSVAVGIINLDNIAFVHAKELLQASADIEIGAAMKNKLDAGSVAGTYRETEENQEGKKDGQNEGDGNGGGAGVGAAFSVIYLDTNATAYIGKDDATGLKVRAAGDVAVKSSLDNKTDLKATAGESDDKPKKGANKYKTAIDAAVAVVITTDDSKAAIKKGATVYAGKDLIVKAVDKSDVNSETKGEATAKSVAAGATVAVNVVVGDVLAELAADGAAGGNVVVDALTESTDKASGTATAQGIDTPKFLSKFKGYADKLDDFVNGKALEKFIKDKKEDNPAKGSEASNEKKKEKETPSADENSGSSETQTNETTNPGDLINSVLTREGGEYTKDLPAAVSVLEANKDKLKEIKVERDSSDLVDDSHSINTDTFDEDSPDDTFKPSDGSNNEPQKDEDRGFTIAAAIGVNIISHDTQAYLTGRILRSDGVVVRAINDNDFRTLSNTGSISKGDALSGSVALLINNSDTIAVNSNSVVVLGKKKSEPTILTEEDETEGVTGNYVLYAITKHNEGFSGVQAQAISGAASTAGKGGYGGSGAIAVVVSNAKTIAQVQPKDGEAPSIKVNDGDVLISAYEKSRLAIRALAAGVSVGLQKEGEPAAAVGVGASFAVLYATEEMEASLCDSAKVTADNVAVLATKEKITPSDAEHKWTVNGYVQIGKEIKYKADSKDAKEITLPLGKKIQINMTDDEDNSEKKYEVSELLKAFAEDILDYWNMFSYQNYYIEAAGGGVAGQGNGNSYAIGGSFAVIFFENTAKALIGENVNIKLNDKGGKVKAAADSQIDATLITGGLAAGKGTAVGVGAGAIANKDIVYAMVGKKDSKLGKTVITGLKGDGLEVKANYDLDILEIAAAGTVSMGGNQEGSGDGAVVIIVSQNDVEAGIYNATLSGNGGNVTVDADNNTKILGVSGGLDLGAGTAVGLGVAFNYVNNKTFAEIDDKTEIGTNKSPLGNVFVTADASEDITTVVINGALSTGGNASVGIGLVVDVFNAKTLAHNFAKSMYAKKAKTTAEDNSDLLTIGGAFTVSLGTADAGGATAAVLIFNKTTEAQTKAETFGITERTITRAEANEDVMTIVAGLQVGAEKNAIGGALDATVFLNDVTAEQSGSGSIGGNVDVKAYDNLDILTVAGELSASGGSNSVGLATDVLINKNNVTANLTGTGDGLTIGGNAVVDLDGISQLYLIAVPVSGSSQLAIAPAVVVEVLKQKDHAAASGKLTVKSLQVDTEDSSELLTLALNLGASGSNAGGAAILVMTYDKEVYAQIGEGSDITATEGDIKVTAKNRDDDKLASAGVAAAGTNAGQGSVVVSVVDTDTLARVSSSETNKTTVNAVKGNVIVTADNDQDYLMIVGGVTASGSNALGASVDTFVFEGKTIAKIADFADVTAGGTTPGTKWYGGTQEKSEGKTEAFEKVYQGVLVGSKSDIKMDGIVVNGAASGSIAISGAVGVITFKEKTGAYIGENAAVKSGKGVAVIALDDTTLLNIAGMVAASGSAAVGVATNTVVFSKTVEARIGKGTKVTAGEDNIVVLADSHEYIDDYVVGVSAGGSAAGSGAVSVIVSDGKITADVGENAELTTDGSILVNAEDLKELFIIAGKAGGSGSVDLGAGVSVITDDTTVKAEAGSGADLFAAGKVDAMFLTLDPDKNRKKKVSGSGINIAASTFNNVTQAAISAGGSGSVSVNAASTTYVNNTDTKAKALAGARLNRREGRTPSANASVKIAAVSSSDLDAGAGGGAVGGTAGVGAAVAVISLGRTTEASIASGSATNAPQDVDVLAGSYNDTKLAGASLGGGTVGLSGGVAVYLAADKTNALLGGEVSTDGKVQVLADSDQKLLVIGGSLSAGMVGVGGAGSAIRFEAETIAKLENGTNISKAGSVSVNALSNVDVNVTAAAVGAGLGGVSGAASVGIIKNKTQALVGNKAVLHVSGDLSVKAGETTKIIVNAGNISAGAGAVGGAVSVITYSGTVTAGIGSDADISAKNVSVEAKTNRDVTSYTVAGSAGGIGIAGSVVVMLVGDKADDEAAKAVNLKNPENNENAGGTALTKSDEEVSKTFETITITPQTEGSGEDSNVYNSDEYRNGIAKANKMISDAKPTESSNDAFTKAAEDKTSAYIAGGQVTASGNIKIQADEDDTLTLVSGSTMAGAAGIGGAVTIATLHGTAEAYSKARLKADGDVSIAANQTAKSDNFYSVAGAASALVGLGASVANLHVDSVTNAFAGEGSRIDAGGDVKILANQKSEIAPKNVGATISGELAVGACVALNDVEAKTTATVEKNADIVRAKSLAVEAVSDISGDVLAIAAGGAISFALSACVAQLDLKGTTEAAVKGNVKGNANGKIGDTQVIAQQLLSSNVKSGAVSLSALGAGEWADTKVTVAPTVNASFEGTADIDGGLNILALYNYKLNDIGGVEKAEKKIAATTYGLAASGGVAGGGARTTVGTKGSVSAKITGANIKAGSVGISANGNYETDAYTGNLQGALAAAIGVSKTTVINGKDSDSNKVSARIESSTVEAGQVSVIANADSNHTAVAEGLSGGLLAAGTGEEAILQDYTAAEASVNGADSKVTAPKGISIVSGVNEGLDASARGSSYALIASGGLSNVTMNADTKSSANAEGTLTTGNGEGGIQIIAGTNHNNKTYGQAAGKAIAGGFVDVTVNMTDTAATTASVGEKANLTTDHDIFIQANETLNNNASATAKTFGLVSTNADTNLTATITDPVKALVGSGAVIQGENVYISANSSLNTVTDVQGGTGGVGLAESSGLENHVTTTQDVDTVIGENALVVADGGIASVTSNGSVSTHADARIEFTLDALSFVKGNTVITTIMNVDTTLGDGVNITAKDIFLMADVPEIDIVGDVDLRTVAIINAQMMPTTTLNTTVNVNVTANGAVKLIAEDRLDILAQVHKVSLDGRSYGYTKGATGSIISEVCNKADINTKIDFSSADNELHANIINLEADSPISIAAKYIRNADLQADTITEQIIHRVYKKVGDVIKKVKDKIVKWLPWPFNKVVEWVWKEVVEPVWDWVEEITFKVLGSEVEKKPTGFYNNTNSINLNGNIYYGQTFSPKVKILADGTVNGLSSEDYVRDDQNRTITIKNLFKTKDKGGFFVTVSSAQKDGSPAGTLSGNVKFHRSNILGESEITNLSDYTIILDTKSLSSVEEDEEEASYVISANDSSKFNVEYVTDAATEQDQLTIDSLGDVIIAKTIDLSGSKLIVNLHGKASFTTRQDAKIAVNGLEIKDAVNAYGENGNAIMLGMTTFSDADGVMHGPVLNVEAKENVALNIAQIRIPGVNDTDPSKMTPEDFRQLHLLAGGHLDLIFRGTLVMTPVAYTPDKEPVEQMVYMEVTTTVYRGLPVELVSSTVEQDGKQYEVEEYVFTEHWEGVILDEVESYEAGDVFPIRRNRGIALDEDGMYSIYVTETKYVSTKELPDSEESGDEEVSYRYVEKGCDGTLNLRDITGGIVNIEILQQEGTRLHTMVTGLVRAVAGALSIISSNNNDLVIYEGGYISSGALENTKGLAGGGELPDPNSKIEILGVRNLMSEKAEGYDMEACSVKISVDDYVGTEREAVKILTDKISVASKNRDLLHVGIGIHCSDVVDHVAIDQLDGGRIWLTELDSGDLIIDELAADRDIKLKTTNGNILSGDAKDVNIKAESLELLAYGDGKGIGTADKPLSMKLTGVNGRAVLAATADGSIYLDSKGETTLGDAFVRSLNGSAVLTAASGVEALALEAGRNLTVTAKNLKVEKGTSGTDMVLTAENNVEATLLEAGGSLTADAGGNVTISQKASAGGDITLTAKEGVNTKNTSSGKDITMTAGKDITAVNAEANGSISLGTTFGDILGTSLYAHGDVILKSDQNITASKVHADGVINANAGRDLSLGMIDGSHIHEAIAGNDAFMEATGDLTIDYANAENNMKIVVSGGDLKSGEIPADKDANLEASVLDITAYEREVPVETESTGGEGLAGEDEEQTVLVGGNIGEKNKPIVTHLKNEAELTANADENIYIRNVGGQLNIKEAEAKNGEAEISSDGNISVSDVKTGKNLTLSSDANVTVDKAEVGGNAAALAKGTSSVSDVKAGGDLTVSGDAGAVAKNSSGRNITVSSTTGDASGESLEAKEDLEVTAQGKASLKEASADNIRVKSYHGEAEGENLTANAELEVAAEITATLKDSSGGNIRVTSEEGEAVGMKLEAKDRIDVTAKSHAYLTDASAENINVEAFNGDADAENLDAKDALNVTAYSSATLKESKAGNAEVRSSNGSAAVIAVKAVEDIDVLAKEYAGIRSSKAKNIHVESTDGDARSAGNRVDEDLTVKAQNKAEAFGSEEKPSYAKNVTVESVAGSSEASYLAVEEDLKVYGKENAYVTESRAKNIDISAENGEADARNVNADEELNVTAKEKVVAKDSGAKNISLESEDDVVDADRLTAGEDLTAKAAGNVSVVDSSAGGDMTVTSASGQAEVKNAQVGKNLTAKASQKAKIENATAGKNITAESAADVAETVNAGAEGDLSVKAKVASYVTDSSGKNVSVESTEGKAEVRGTTAEENLKAKTNGIALVSGSKAKNMDVESSYSKAIVEVSGADSLKVRAYDQVKLYEIGDVKLVDEALSRKSAVDIQSKSDVTVRKLSAAVQVTADLEGSLYAVEPEEGEANVYAPLLTVRVTGNIGTPDQRIVMNGGKVSASVEKDAYLSSIGDLLYFTDITANHLDVTATGDINGRNIVIKSMTMTADGDIGKENEYMTGNEYSHDLVKLTSTNGKVYYWKDGKKPGHSRPGEDEDVDLDKDDYYENHDTDEYLDIDSDDDNENGGNVNVDVDGDTDIRKGAIGSPQTGDTSNAAMYYLLLALSALTILAVLLRKRRYEK